MVTSPGVKVRVSESGLNYAAKEAIDVMSKRVKHVTIPDQEGICHYGFENITARIIIIVIFTWLYVFPRCSR